MLQQDMARPSEQLPIEEVSSPISSQIFDFGESEFFQETINNPEVAAAAAASNSNGCCYDDNSSYSNSLSLTPEIGNFTSTTTTAIYDDNNNYFVPKNASTPTTANTSGATPTSAVNNQHHLPVIFDSPEEIENEISASIDISPSPPFSVPAQLIKNQQQEQFDFSSLQCHPLVDGNDGLRIPQNPSSSVFSLVNAPLPPVYETECLNSAVPPPYVRLNPSSGSCSFLDPSSVSPYVNGPISAENSGIFSSNLFLGNALPSQDLDFQGENGGFFWPEPPPQSCGSGEFQPTGNENQQGASSGNGGSGGNSTPLAATEISSLEDSPPKVAKLSVEQRKEKIHRYMKKRNERNFSKKIKYACRKTLADSRPRVRGRFAKNDDFGEPQRSMTSSNHEEDTDEDAIVKEEEIMVDSSDIFARFDGVNSFEYNYSIQSWI